jgi:signal transduction histidine kinase
MSKQSGERARPALGRFASDPRKSVELRGRERAESMTRSVDAFLAMLALFNRGGKRSDGQNAGIGLAVVHRLIQLHGGTVRAASDGAGRGSEFTVILPRHLSA